MGSLEGRYLHDMPGSLSTVARLIAYYGVRNSELENIHVHSITDPEMRVLMLDIEKQIEAYLKVLIACGLLTINEGAYTAADLGDWHSILAHGPSYDFDGWTPD